MSSRLRWIAGIAAGVLLLALAYIGGLVTPSSTPGDNSPEAGFARDMTIHHAQAVAMAMIIWQAPLLTDTPADADASRQIHGLANDIALQQQQQIGQMAVWLQDWHLQPTGTQPHMAWMPDGQQELVGGLMPGMATTDQINQLTTDTGRQQYILFCQLMLRHHQGGIHMVEGVLDETHNSQVRDLAESMKTGQLLEVGLMQQLLTELGAQPLPS